MKNINKKEEKKRTQRIQPPAGPTISQARRCGPSPRRRCRRIKRDEWWLDIENTRRRSGHGIGKKRYKTIKWRNKRERVGFSNELVSNQLESLGGPCVPDAHGYTVYKLHKKAEKGISILPSLFFWSCCPALPLFSYFWGVFFPLATSCTRCNKGWKEEAKVK